METAPEGAVSEIVVLVECEVELSNSPFWLGLAGKNVNCDDGGHDSNGRGHHHSNSVFLYMSGGDGRHRRW
jgi:hypothetical protein